MEALMLFGEKACRMEDAVKPSRTAVLFEM